MKNLSDFLEEDPSLKEKVNYDEHKKRESDDDCSVGEAFQSYKKLVNKEMVTDE